MTGLLESAPLFCRIEHAAWSWVFPGPAGRQPRDGAWVDAKGWSRLTLGKVKASQPRDVCTSAFFGCLAVPEELQPPMTFREALVHRGWKRTSANLRLSTGHLLEALLWQGG